ncbi:Gfo/Idh/MocA family protein [Paraclostridium bifermentans]|uniref:Gfo/Idh/MocA family protein n=1 Tax=Paraclostridium bifermentans TaxID=1490 RepID=UPI00189FA8AB|nr:Gfo/Idh/MocA family oxidoreductase [Paraclostridium bifermentans]
MIRIGIICPSEIAFRRFMPALSLEDNFEFVGIGVNSICERFGEKIPSKEVVEEIMQQEYSKAKNFIDNYGGKIFDGYEAIINSDEVDAVYIPLPPALHFKWAKRALEAGKHVLVEKPSTVSESMTKELVDLANKKSLALHENYMFTFHNQLQAINNIIAKGDIGDVRLYSIKFGFPQRELNDFRYNKELGGGALIDAGGYTIKYASMLLGNEVKITCANMNYIDKFEVDMYGSATLVNELGETAQIAFGMDNSYKCELEVWGSKGVLKTGRVLTAPVDFIPSASIIKGNENIEIKLPADDSFLKSIIHFRKCIEIDSIREESYKVIEKQAKLVESFREKSYEIKNRFNLE